MNRRTIVLVDNSIDFTGAFKCALQQADLMQHLYRYVFVLPQQSNLYDTVTEHGHTVYRLPMLEIKKSVPALLKYVPVLLRNVSGLKKILKNERADILVMNDFYNLLGVAIRSSNRSIRLITYVRFLPNAMPGPLRRIWISLALRYADRIIAVSDTVLQQLPAANKSVRIYDPVVEKDIAAPVHQAAANSVIELVYLSNYIRGKGHDHALNAFRKAFRHNSGLRLTFYGNDMGLQKNKDFKTQLEQEVVHHGLEQAVRFFPFQKDIAQAFQQAHIFLNCSESESFSMTCLEAGYYGIPAIATRCGGPEEIIVDGETGLLVENRNIEQICDAIVKLAQSAEMRQRFSVNARTHIRKKFSREAFVAAFGNILKEME